MRLVRLPASGETAEDAERLRSRLLDAGSDAPPIALNGELWLRISAQAYNEESDYRRLAEIVAAVVEGGPCSPRVRKEQDDRVA
jgi:isopenicillin-N epimerase